MSTALRIFKPFAKAMENRGKFLLEQAARCRRLAGQLTDRELAQTLLALGEDYVERARAWDAITAARPAPDRTSAASPPPIGERH